MIKSKKFWIVAAAGAVTLSYAMVSSNAFADTTVTPAPTVTTQATPSVAPANPLSTPPAAGNSQDQGDGQVGDQSIDENQNGDNEDGAAANANEGDQGTSGDNTDAVSQIGNNQDGSSTNND